MTEVGVRRRLTRSAELPYRTIIAEFSVRARRLSWGRVRRLCVQGAARTTEGRDGREKRIAASHHGARGGRLHGHMQRERRRRRGGSTREDGAGDVQLGELGEP